MKATSITIKYATGQLDVGCPKAGRTVRADGMRQYGGWGRPVVAVYVGGEFADRPELAANQIFEGRL